MLLVISGHAGWHHTGGSYDPRVRCPFVPCLVAPLVALMALAGCGGDDDSDGASGLEGLVTERIGPYEHLMAPIDYDRPAPSGGDHLFAPFWLNCGVYEGEVPDELAVHSLEHGAVWIALGSDSTDADRERAAELADGRKAFVSDVPDLEDPVQLVAWGVRLPLDSLEGDAPEAFLDEFIDGSGAPEAGLSCSSEFGQPPTPPELQLG
jgi:Protein of unknown function (DUF3105)